uniref:Histone H1 n=1 Tax=viral metagenome TaxID=1070528 RepID=A0A6H1ZZC1_9ZZZZ
MAKGEETFQEIVKWVEIVKTEGEKFYAGNKSAGVRARKALDRLAKLKVQWRKETV